MCDIRVYFAIITVNLPFVGQIYSIAHKLVKFKEYVLNSARLAAIFLSFIKI